MLNRLPGVAWHAAPRHADGLGAIERDVGGHDSGLELARLGVLPSPSEQPGGLDVVVADLLQVAVDDRIAVLVLQEPDKEEEYANEYTKIEKNRVKVKTLN